MPEAPLFTEEGDETYPDGERHNRERVLDRRTFLHLIIEADRPLAGGARYSLEGVNEVVVVRGRERRATREAVAGRSRLTLCVPARSLSSVHARIRRLADGWWLEDAGSTNGSYVNGARVARALLRQDDTIEAGHVFLSIRSCALSTAEQEPDVDAAALSSEPAGFVTLLPDFARHVERLRRVAGSALPVTLIGDTGTGKEVLARALHKLSGRSGDFIAINCAALTQSLVESQLFGHVRGAFSGAAADTPGFIRSAQAGTLLLDEIKELPLTTQAALLRVLQEREVIPVGAARAQSVDVRYIATAPFPLERAVRSHEFRADLLARLSGFVFHLPVLRERREDLGLLIATLLKKSGASNAAELTLAPELALSLIRYDWPLNIRELELLLARALIVADGRIGLKHVCMDYPLRSDARAATRDCHVEQPRNLVLSAEEQALRDVLVDKLTSCQGNVAQVARSLGKAPVQVHRWMKRLGVQPAEFRTRIRAQSGT